MIEPGQLIAAKGTIGCGKTTLINLICGLIKPDSGQIYVDNLDITSKNYDTLSEFRANLFGIVPQKTNLVPELTITQTNAFQTVDGKNIYPVGDLYNGNYKYYIARTIDYSPTNIFWIIIKH